MIYCFFFSSRRRHTRLTCDWSSDVCSSDLGASLRRRSFCPDGKTIAYEAMLPNGNSGSRAALVVNGKPGLEYRSEERRVGKECRFRWSPGQYKKKDKWTTEILQR